ncbi:hypothetical protein Hdeb2414_s0001g00007351 [Helianthus debilis subsp. tardiflorus]
MEECGGKVENRTQRDIVIACFAVHNFIRKCNIRDQLFVEYGENTLFSEIQGGEIQGGENIGQFVHDIEWGSQDIEYMTTLRNQIDSQLIEMFKVKILRKLLISS